MCKACKTIVFHYQICKFVTFLLPSSSWLRNLPMAAKTSWAIDLALVHQRADSTIRFGSIYTLNNSVHHLNNWDLHC